MKVLRGTAAAVSIVALFLSGPTVKAKDKDKTPNRITVSFGTGNNNAAPGNTPNHHILPQEFTVAISKARRLENGAVVFVPATVNFIVSGFHWPWVYNPGTTLAQVRQAALAGTGLFVNFDQNVMAKGVDPTVPTFFPMASAQNRTESFAFDKPGRYLVICNVRPHLLDGMYAWVHVVDDDDN
jgi:hypothetical protein